MIYHKETNTLEIENWKEYFRTEISNDFVYDIYPMLLSKGYVGTEIVWCKNTTIFWKWYLVFFIRLNYWFKKIWWIIPLWLHKRGHYKHTEGEKKYWFWLPRIRIRKIKNRF